MRARPSAEHGYCGNPTHTLKQSGKQAPLRTTGCGCQAQAQFQTNGRAFPELSELIDTRLECQKHMDKVSQKKRTAKSTAVYVMSPHERFANLAKKARTFSDVSGLNTLSSVPGTFPIQSKLGQTANPSIGLSNLRPLLERDRLTAYGEDAQTQVQI